MKQFSTKVVHSVDVGPVTLESGVTLDAVQVAFEIFGTLNADRSNAILLHHALTGDSHAGSGSGKPGWWEGVVGPAKALNTDRWAVVVPNVLGGCAGTTGPSSVRPDGVVYGSSWPRVTIRDQVKVEALLADRLGIEAFALVAGGSMGGMRALEWAIMFPSRVGSAWVGASCAAATADQIGTQTAQIGAIMADPEWCGGDYIAQGKFPSTGLGLARQFAHLTYRTADELEVRFGRATQLGENPLAGITLAEADGSGGRFAVQSYLDYQGKKLSNRFDPASYVCLTDAMNTHDVGRGRGGVDSVLGNIEVPLRVAAVNSDRLYFPSQSERIANRVSTCFGFDIVTSPFGHDGFLLETSAVGQSLRKTLSTSEARTSVAV